jgi:NitT/TauT family transport system permease protein
MKYSTMSLSRWRFVAAAVFWLLVWHVASVMVGQDILLVSPIAAAERLVELARTPQFWAAAGFSLSRIMGGFALALTAGIGFAAAAYRSPLAHTLLSPLTSAAKSVPVASYTILCLVFMRARHLPVVIAFLMTLPIVYDTLLEGLRNTDGKMLEMARVFRFSPIRRLRAVYIPQATPYMVSAVGVGVGIAWKSGVAAEVMQQLVPIKAVPRHAQSVRVDGRRHADKLRSGKTHSPSH